MTSATLLDPIGFTVSGDDPESLTVALPSWRPDCGGGDRRHRGGRRATTATATSRSWSRGRRSTAISRRSSSAAAGCASCLVGLGISEVMPSPFLVRRAGRRDRARRRRPARHEPVGRRRGRPATVAAPWAPAGGGIQRVAPAASASRCSRSATCTRRVRASSPTSARCLASCSPARRRRRRWPCGARSRRCSESARGSTRVRCRPDCIPTRSATLLAGRDRIGAVGEFAPDVLEAFGIDERVAVLELNLTIVLAAEPKPVRWKATSRHPSSDLDLAFVAR